MAGKGDKPRNCFSKNFKNNFDGINWNKKEKLFKKVKTKIRFTCDSKNN
jgi:hypothetical protein